MARTEGPTTPEVTGDLAVVVEAARRWLAELGKQASKYERLADEERVRLFGNARAGAAEGGKPFQTGHDKVAAETMRDYYRPLKDAIAAVVGGAVVDRDSVVEALRDGHRHDSAAEQVEFVSDLVGWSAEDDPDL